MSSVGHLILAYHGCDASTRDALIAGKTQLQPSSNAYDWLGKGVYFFEGDWRRALKFAAASFDRPKEKLTAKPIRHPAVVGAVLRVGYWLDMSTQAGIDEFEVAYAKLFEERGGKYMPVNKSARDGDSDVLLRALDRTVFNKVLYASLTSAGQKYDAVRGPFPQGRPVAPSSSICRDTHVQIAVRNMDCVLGYFRVIEAAPAEAEIALRIAAAK